jgi:predicted transcriptional regulator with HTH domain
MPKISKQKKDRISEQILHHLFTISPEAAFTVSIAKEIARDEEFTKSLLKGLQERNLIVEVKKNKNGLNYTRRQRWRLSNEAFLAYKKSQDATSKNIFFSEEA